MCLKLVNLYKMLHDKSHRVICEIGVNLPQHSKALKLIGTVSIKQIILVEPSKHCFEVLISDIAKYKDIHFTMFNCAVSEISGDLYLYATNESCQSAFIDRVPNSPMLNRGISKDGLKVYKITSRKIEEIDPGNIDVLYLDCEGAEWFALKNLISRPRIIQIEMQGKTYKNPFFNDIIKWMKNNNYELSRMEDSDFIYIRRE